MKLRVTTGFWVTVLAVLALTGSAQAANYYWDTNGSTAGLGDTAGTWDAAGNSFVSNMNGPNSRTPATGTIATNNQATTTSDWMSFGTVNLGLGSTASTVTVGTRTIGNIVFGAGQANPVTLTGGTITLAGAGSVTANNTSDTISSVLGGAATSFTKGGAGTLNLTGENIYTGATIVSGGGTLTVGDGTTGSLNGITGTALTFNNGGGAFNVAQAAGSTQGMGALTFTAGDGAVTSTAFDGISTATLTFASLAARAAGVTGNFSLAINTAASDNKIVLTDTTNAPVDTGSNDPGFFFGGTEYVRYDTANGYFRAVNYGTDTNASAIVPTGATLGIDDSANDVKISGDITAQTTAAVNTLNLAANTLTLQDTSQVLSVNGILATGGAIATAGAMQSTSAGGEMVFHVASGTLSVEPIIQNNTSASPLTKSGAGTLTLSGANTYTGTTRINAGALAVSGGAAIADAGAVVLANAAGATLLLNNDETIGSLSGGGLSGGNVNVQGNTLTLSDDITNQTFGGAFSGTGGGAIIKQGTGMLTLSNPNSFAGTLTLSAGSLRFALGNNGSSSALSLSSGGAILMNDNTALRFDPVADLTSGNLGTALQRPSTFTFTNAINVIAGTANIRFGLHDPEWDFSGGVTGGTSGAQTLAIYQGGIATNSGDRQKILFSGVIANGSGGALGVNVNFGGASGVNQGAYVSLSNTNTFTGPINVANSKGLNYVLSSQWGGYFVIGGVRRNGLTTVGSGSLGNGNYTNTISLALGTVLDYLSSADQILGGEISGAGSILKEGTGTLTLSGVNTYTGDTAVNTGKLELADNAQLTFVIGASGTNNKIAGAGTLSLAGDFLFDLSNAGQTIDDQWTIVADSLAETYESTFLVTSTLGAFTADGGGDKWTKMIPSTGLAYEFSEATGVLKVVVGILPGDTNGDNVVDAADFISLKRNFGSGLGGDHTVGNFDGVGTVDWNDLNTLTTHMGDTSPASAMTPEPATLGLLMVGALAVIRRTRKS